MFQSGAIHFIQVMELKPTAASIYRTGNTTLEHLASDFHRQQSQSRLFGKVVIVIFKNQNCDNGYKN